MESFVRADKKRSSLVVLVRCFSRGNIPLQLITHGVPRGTDSL